MKIMAFATALTLALGALTLPFSESGYNFAYKAAASAQAGTNDFKYDSADIFTADSLLNRAILPDGERIFDHDPILAYTPTTRDWLFKQTAEEVVDNSWLISADTLWLNAEKAFSFEFVGEDSVFTRQQFIYETIIMDYLTYQYQSDEFKSDIEKSTTKFMYKIEKKVLDNEILSDEAFDNKIKGMSKEDAADFAKEQNYLKRFNEVNVSAYDSLIDGAETAKDYFKKLSKLMALQEASTTRLDFLQKIKDNTDDKALIKAIDDITAKYNDELSNVVWNEFLQTGMETFNGVVWDSIKDFFKKKFKIEIPGFSSIKLGMAGIDWAFNEKGMAESRIQLTILYIIHADVMQTYIDMRDSYINSGTEESAQEFVNAYSQYLAFIAYSSGITKEYLGETLIDGAYNSIKNLFSSTNQTAYNDYCSALNSEVSICQTLDKYVGLAKDFYNKMSGYNTSEDTKVPESAAIGTRFTSGYLTYEVTAKGEVEVHDCNNSADSVNIPKIVSYDGYDYYVTSIGDKTFEYCTDITDITMPDSITSIGDEAFYDCKSLTSIIIPDGVVCIDSKAFWYCDSLKSIIIPKSVESINDDAFGSSFESITVISNKVSLNYYTFNCFNLKEIVINEDNPNYCSVDGVLYNKEKTKLIKCPRKKKSINILNTTQVIGKYAFLGCSELSNIIIPNNVTNIEEAAFSNCEGLTAINIPSSIKTIGFGAFDGCNKLLTIDIPNSVESIGGRAFRDCESLNKITIPNSVKTIGNNAFENCSGLLAINIPNSVDSIGEYAFRNCESLINITVSSNNKKYLSKDGVLFNYNGTELIQYPLGDGKSEYVIPNNVEEIGKYAFYNCKNLRSVTINESVKVIDEYAFSDCINLNNLFIQRQTYNNIVIIPYIGFNYYSFYNCSNLTDIYYMGSLNDWQNLWKAEYNDALEKATIHYNYGVHVHSYTESITKQPTCTEEGEKTFTCDCGDTYTEIIPAKGHTEVIDKAVPVTCTTDGKTEGSHCYVCGEVIKAQTVIKATGHKYDDGKITKQPTCTETGVKTYTCSECGATKTETIKANGHTEVIDKAVPATCTTDGKIEGSHCSVCGEVIKAQTVIKATGHNFGSWSTTKAATCTESGTQTRKCASCGKTETKTIPATGHKSSGWIIDKQPAVGVKGSKHKECTVCHARLETATIPALAVTKQSISKASVTLSTSTYAYDGKAKKPGVTVKLNGKTLKNGTDYTVSYSNNTKVGTAKVTITGKGNYTGSVSKTYSIKNNFKKATVSGISTKAFTGKDITQSITVKYNGKTLKNGTDYTVSYSNNKKIGIATVKIAGKGSYTGTVTKTFKINPAKQEIQKLTAKSKAFFIDWAQKGSATGYEIQYATNSKFTGAKKATITNNKTDKTTVSKLSANKKYYVRVRSYTTVKGTKYYGAWSATKTVTTKK